MIVSHAVIQMVPTALLLW